MWNKNWKTYKQRKSSNRSKQIKDLHNHTNSRQNQSKHRMPANVSVKGGKTKRTLKTRGKNACWDAPGKSAFMLAFCFSIQRNIFDAFRYKEGGPTRSGSRYDGGRGGQRQLPYYSCTLLDFCRPITETSNKLPSAISHRSRAQARARWSSTIAWIARKAESELPPKTLASQAHQQAPVEV